jgi:hypothetical protein
MLSSRESEKKNIKDQKESDKVVQENPPAPEDNGKIDKTDRVNTNGGWTNPIGNTGGNSSNREIPPSPPVNTDPDGDGFIGLEDKCPNEFGGVDGCPDSDADGVPDNKDKCDDKPGPANNNGCPKPITISVDLAMSSQNNFTWNSKVAEEGLKATLVFQTNSGAEFRKDVTGLSSFKFKSGDTRFDGVMTNVELIITSKDGVKLSGVSKGKYRTTC